MADRTPSRVRAFLREELPRWRAEGILDEQGAETLTRRYLGEPEGTGLAVAALYVLAASLVGAGIISLVAAHWDELPRFARLAILGTALVAAHGVGFWMWQVRANRPRFGHAVSLLGTLVFGASIGLVAQLFHVSGPWYGAFGAWALGALVAGLVLPSLPALGLTIFLGLFVWGPGFIDDHARLGDALAWLAGGGALALSLRAGSRALFALATVGLGVVLVVASVELPGPRSVEQMEVGATLLGLSAALCAFSAAWIRGAPHRFAGVAGALGRLSFAVLAYWLSFEEIAREVLPSPAEWSRAWVTCALPVLIAAAALGAYALRAREERSRALTAAVATGLAAAYAAVAFAGAPSVALAVAANVALLALAAIRIVHGLQAERRGPFWEGLGLAAVVACSRFVAIDELLWLKGLGFIACGVGVIVAAVQFEKRVLARSAEVRHA